MAINMFGFYVCSRICPYGCSLEYESPPSASRQIENATRFTTGRIRFVVFLKVI